MCTDGVAKIQLKKPVVKNDSDNDDDEEEEEKIVKSNPLKRKFQDENNTPSPVRFPFSLIK